MSEGGPRAVSEGPAGDDEVSLDAGRRALLERVRDDLVGPEKTRQTVAGAVAVDRVAKLSEFADRAGRDGHSVSNNDTLDTLDETGLSLRVPPVNKSVNDEGLYAFYDYQQAFLAGVAAANAPHQVTVQDDERARRALSYAGAEMIAKARVETDSDAPSASQGASAETDDGAGASRDTGDDEPGIELDDRVRETCAEYGFDPSAGARAVRDRVQQILDEDMVSVAASGRDSDEQAVRDDLKDLRSALNLVIETREVREERGGPADDAGEDGEGSDDDSDAEAGPDPEAGVLGYDWVRTDEERPWTGRSLRALLYAVLTESDEVGPEPGAVDRVELINYGEPTVRGYEVPTDRSDVTLLGDEDIPYPEDEANQHAIDFRIVGDLDREEGARLVEDRLQQHLNAVHLLARYEPSMGRASDRGDEPEGLAADGAGEDDYTEEAARRRERLDMPVPFDRVPVGLWRAMEDTKLRRRAGDYEVRVYGSADEVVGTSRSWQQDKS